VNAVLQQLIGLVRRHPFTVVSFTLFVLLAAANVVLWQQQIELTQRHDEVRHSGETMLLALTDRPRINADLAAVQQAVDRIDQNLIAEGDLAENYGYFYQIETSAHVHLTQLNQLTAPAGGEGNPFKAVPFTLRATGTYAQLISFIRELETGPHLLRVKAYDFSRGDPKTGTLNLGLTVELLSRP